MFVAGSKVAYPDPCIIDVFCVPGTSVLPDGCRSESPPFPAPGRVKPRQVRSGLSFPGFQFPDPRSAPRDPAPPGPRHRREQPGEVRLGSKALRHQSEALIDRSRHWHIRPPAARPTPQTPTVFKRVPSELSYRSSTSFLNRQLFLLMYNRLAA